MQRSRGKVAIFATILTWPTVKGFSSELKGSIKRSWRSYVENRGQSFHSWHDVFGVLLSGTKVQKAFPQCRRDHCGDTNGEIQRAAGLLVMKQWYITYISTSHLGSKIAVLILIQPN